MGNYHLDTLQEMAVAYFGSIENKNIARTSFEGIETFSENGRGLGHLFKVVPDKDTHELQVIWPKLTGFKWQYKHNNYLTHVLGHEGPNSLLAELSKKGFATTLMAGSANRLYGKDGEIKITIGLTKKGVEQYFWVLSMLFAFIAVIKK